MFSQLVIESELKLHLDRMAPSLFKGEQGKELFEKLLKNEGACAAMKNLDTKFFRFLFGVDSAQNVGLAQSRFDLFLLHKNCIEVIRGFNRLIAHFQASDEWLGKMLDYLLKSSEPMGLVQVIIEFEGKGLSHLFSLLQTGQDAANFTLFLQCQYPYSMARALMLLYDNKLFEQFATLALQSKYPFQFELLEGISRLHVRQLLVNESYCAAVVGALRPSMVADILVMLKQANLLSDENLNLVVQVKNHSSELNFCLNILEKANLLTQDNFELLAKHGNLGSLYWNTFSLLDRQGLLKDSASAQANFNLALQNSEATSKALRLLEDLHNRHENRYGRYDEPTSISDLIQLCRLHLSEKDRSLVHEAAKLLITSTKASGSTPLSAFGWDLLELLGNVYQPSSKHPIHRQIAAAMRWGR